MSNDNPVSVRFRFTSTVRRDVDGLVRYGCVIKSGSLEGNHILLWEGYNQVYCAKRMIGFLWVVSKYDSDCGIIWI